MNKFIKLSVCFICVLLSVFFASCKKTNPVTDKLCELRYNIYEGGDENMKISACYGFKENPHVNDGKISDLEYILTVKILNKNTSNSDYSFSVSHSGKTYKGNFSYNPNYDALLSSVQIDGFDLQEFNITVTGDGETKAYNLKTVIPPHTISYETALSRLTEKQNSLMESYIGKDNCGEICMRVLVRNGKSYWYVGLLDGKGNTKALLVDGISGEVLAIRDII